MAALAAQSTKEEYARPRGRDKVGTLCGRMSREPQEQAEAMAAAALSYIMGELVTREELRRLAELEQTE